MQIKENETIKSLFIRLWNALSKRRKAQFKILFLLMIVNGAAEFVSIGAVVPFIGIISNPGIVLKNRMINNIAKYFGILNASDLLFPITVIFVSVILVSGLIRFLLLKINTFFLFACNSDFCMESYRKTLYRPYQVHVSRNSSDIINGIISKISSTTYGAIQPFLTMVSSIVMILFIESILIVVSPFVTLVSTLFFIFIYLCVGVYVKKKLKVLSFLLTEKSTKVIKILQESLGGIRDILIDETQSTYCSIFNESDIAFKNAQRDTMLISMSPRIFIETILMVSISYIVFLFVNHNLELISLLPLFAAFILGAQKLIPSIQQVYNGYTNIQAARQSMIDSLELIEQDEPEISNRNTSIALSFEKEIRFKNIFFHYINSEKYVLQDLNLIIKKGSRIGIIGKTGSGKSTVLDLLMGLLSPIKGELIVDDKEINKNSLRSWQRNIAHVPQNIFLTDSSIMENIAFGQKPDEIDEVRVRKVAEMAKLSVYIENLPEQYHTKVGERGLLLSGGQRQRIGIARALYKQANVLILDEATNALDNQTEFEIMEMISALNKNVTVIIVAHRLSTLNLCDFVYNVKDGKLCEIENLNLIANIK